MASILSTVMNSEASTPLGLVYVDGKPLHDYTNEITVRNGFDATSSVATVTLDTIPTWLRKQMQVKIELGYRGAVPQTVPVFDRGFVEDDGRKSWPIANTIGAAGRLKRAQYRQKGNYTYAGQTDQAIITALLALRGLTDVDIAGDGVSLGTEVALKLSKGQAPIDLISRIDQVLGYHTFDVLGRVKRQRITRLPGPHPSYTYSEALGNIYDIDFPTTIRGAQNGVHVSGMRLADGTTPIADREGTNPLIPSDLGVIVLDFSGGEIIQTQALADSVAVRVMEEVNGEANRITLTVPGNPYVQPGMTIAVQAPSVGVGTATNLWLESYGHFFKAGDFKTKLTLWGTLGSAGWAVDYGPHAIFTYAIERFLYTVLGTPTLMYLVPCDGTPSWDPDDPQADLTFAWENNKNADTDSAVYYGTAFSHAEIIDATKPAITLTVTDPDGNTDAVTQEIDFGTVLQRELYVAALAKAYATPDGGQNWNSWAPGGGVTVTSTPKRNGNAWGVFGCSDGALVYTADFLATAPTAVHSFGSQINAIWLNEVDANRCLVACNNGKVYLSNNLSLLALSTWTEVKDYGVAVNYLGEDPFNRGQVWVCVGSELRLTFDEFASDGVRATFTGGTARRFQGSAYGNFAVGTAAAPCRDDQDAAHAYPVLVPVVSDVRAVAHHIRDDVVWTLDTTGRFFAKAIGDAAFTLVATHSIGTAHDLLADGDEPFVLYLGGADGVYISPDQGTTIFPMLTLAAGDEEAVQLGYGALDWQRIVATTVVSAPTATDPNIKALSLWNGSGNDSSPDGWRDLTFDDSAWVASVEAGNGTNLPPTGSTAIWTSVAPLQDSEQCLFRQTFVLGAGVVSAVTLSVRFDDECLGVWINGVFILDDRTSNSRTIDPGVTVTVPTQALIPGGTNVIAVWGKNVYPTHAYASWRLEVS